MSLRLAPIGPIPEQTARVARAAFPRGTRWMRLRDELGAIYEDGAFQPLFSTRGRPAEAPWRLALVSVMQFAEDLSDRQAADAVRGRIDWKYLLGLALDDPGFDSTVLVEFRARLVAGGLEQRLLDALLVLCRARGWLRAGARQRTDSTHVLAASRAVQRVGCARQALRNARNTLAAVAPEWLRRHAPPEWVKRYDRHNDDPWHPTQKGDRAVQAATVGADGAILLGAVYAADAPSWLREVPAVELLRRVWMQNYVATPDGLRWRTHADGRPPSARYLSTPHDLDARSACQQIAWIGYKAHLTETCEPQAPHLITHVETTMAPVPDGTMTPTIHEALLDRALLPWQHLVDTGYVDAELLVSSLRDYRVDLVGPARPDVKWQARAGHGFEAARFTIDWARRTATCPAGQTSISWTPAIDKRTNPVIKIKFSEIDCGACASRAQCLDPRRRTKYPRRTLTIRPEEQYRALQAARERQVTAAFGVLYGLRAGIEGTISQAVRSCGLRRSRYVGQPKTHLGHVLTAVAVNLQRIDDWLTDTPRSATRHSAFARLMAPSTS
jgi:transposase